MRLAKGTRLAAFTGAGPSPLTLGAANGGDGPSAGEWQRLPLLERVEAVRGQEAFFLGRNFFGRRKGVRTLFRGVERG